MKNLDFYDRLSIIPNLNDTDYFDNLKIELEEKYHLNLKLLDNFDFDEVAYSPFYFTYSLLSHYNSPVKDYSIFCDLEFHCFVSSLYTCEFLTSKDISSLSNKDLNIYSLPKKNEVGTHPSTIINRFKKFRDNNLKYLINSCLVPTAKQQNIHIQKFLQKFLYFFDIVETNSPYLSLKDGSDNKSKFSQSFKRRLDPLISDYSQLLNLCMAKNMPKNIVNNTLYYYKLENTFQTSLLMKNIGKLSNMSINIEKFNLLAKLPNVFSRNSWGDLIDNNEHIDYLANFLIPLYQKVFFFLLYDYSGRYDQNGIEQIDFYSRVNAVKYKLSHTLVDIYSDDLCSFFDKELSYMPYPAKDLYDKSFEFVYNYKAAKDISDTLKMLYINEITVSYTFPNFSSEKLITYLYNLKKMPPSQNTENLQFHLAYKMLKYVDDTILPTKYSDFLIFKNAIMLNNYEYNFPSSDNENLEILFTYLSDLAYCCVLIKYTVNYSLDFIKRFIPLFNASFNVISEVNDYSRLFHTIFDIKEIKFSTFSSDEMINALKIMRDASCYFSEVIFEFDELTMLSVDLSNNNEFSKLKSNQTELYDLIISFEQELNKLPLS